MKRLKGVLVDCVLTSGVATAACIGIAAITPLEAKAGCGPAEGLMQICYKGTCEVQKLVRQCSSASLGNGYSSDVGYYFGYSNYIGGMATWMRVIDPLKRLVYEGDPDGSPYKFDICGGRHTGGPCAAKPWAK